MMQTVPKLRIEATVGEAVTVTFLDQDGEVITETTLDDFDPSRHSADISPEACTAVFGGHYWDMHAGSDVMQVGVGTFNAPRSRTCKLCGHRQVEHREWRDSEL